MKVLQEYPESENTQKTHNSHNTIQHKRAIWQGVGQGLNTNQVKQIKEVTGAGTQVSMLGTSSRNHRGGKKAGNQNQYMI